MAGGGIRGNKIYDAGTELTRRDILTELPFGNRTVKIEVTGETIWAALENGVSQVENSAGRFPQVSGLSFEADAATIPGDVVARGQTWTLSVTANDGEADGTVVEHADLSAVTSGHCNDMVVGPLGNAYVGNFGFDFEGGESPASATLAIVWADGTVTAWGASAAGASTLPLATLPRTKYRRGRRRTPRSSWLQATTSARTWDHAVDGTVSNATWSPSATTPSAPMIASITGGS